MCCLTKLGLPGCRGPSPLFCPAPVAAHLLSGGGRHRQTQVLPAWAARPLLQSQALPGWHWLVTTRVKIEASECWLSAHHSLTLLRSPTVDDTSQVSLQSLPAAVRLLQAFQLAILRCHGNKHLPTISAPGLVSRFCLQRTVYST